MARLRWLLGGGAVAAYLWSRRGGDGRTPATAAGGVLNAPLTSLTGRWIWPVARWGERSPVISDGFGSPRPGGRRHGGVDLMFRRLPADTLRAGTPNGSAGHVMPDGVIALAASDGVVWSAGATPRGLAVVIDHGEVATFYTHLEKLFVTPTNGGKAGQRVIAGQPIGIIGFDPLDGARLKHLHFEIWRGGAKGAIDPAPLMASWAVLADPRAEHRNAALVYRPLGDRGEDYPEWVRALRGKSGVYVIRQGGETVYVGESHTGRLYETLTRHFQTWRRWKGFWRGQYSEGHDPGLTYRRDSVEVAVRVLSPTKALDEEARLIRRLEPRDNLRGQVEAEDVIPF
jgi:hypothetical protein